jgi:hypothetical protein
MVAMQAAESVNIPCLGDDNVVEGGVGAPEARESDLNYHGLGGAIGIAGGFGASFVVVIWETKLHATLARIFRDGMVQASLISQSGS